MKVVLTSSAQKQVKKIPQHIADKLLHWIEQVNTHGVESVRKIPGFHDEPLRGQRRGQRSIRLSKSWRAIYKVIDNIVVIEVNHHDY